MPDFGTQIRKEVKFSRSIPRGRGRVHGLLCIYYFDRIEQENGQQGNVIRVTRLPERRVMI